MKETRQLSFFWMPDAAQGVNAPATITTLLKPFPTFHSSQYNQWDTIYWHRTSCPSPAPYWDDSIGACHTAGISCWWSCFGTNLEEIIDLVLHPVLASYVQSIFNCQLSIWLCSTSIRSSFLWKLFLHLHDSYINSQGLQCPRHVDSSWIFTCLFFLSYLHPCIYYSSMTVIWVLLPI